MTLNKISRELPQQGRQRHNDMLGSSVFQGVSQPCLKGVGPQDPPIITTSYKCAHSMRNNNQIWHGIKLDVRKIFTRSDTNADM